MFAYFVSGHILACSWW